MEIRVYGPFNELLRRKNNTTTCKSNCTRRKSPKRDRGRSINVSENDPLVSFKLVLLNVHDADAVLRMPNYSVPVNCILHFSTGTVKVDSHSTYGPHVMISTPFLLGVGVSNGSSVCFVSEFKC